MATLDYVSDWTKRLKSRLYTQFRDAVTWQQWATFLGSMAQDWEDAAQTLLTSLDIDASVGAQLDVIGRIVGQPRAGAVDSLYRLYLRSRVLANLSTGTVEDIFAVMRALIGTDALPTYQGGLVKQFAIRIGKVITREQALAGVEFLGIAKEAAARGILEWQESPSAEMFTLWDAAVLTTPVVAGVVISTIDVTSTTGYPAYGDMKFGDDNVSFFMNGKTSTTFTTSIPVAITASYGVGTPVGMIASEVGEANVGLDNGNFAGAIQA